MRAFIILLTLVLVSCASPKSKPDAFYGGVYAPGLVEISETGAFTSRAGVFDAADRETARKAAFARLLLQGKQAGYRYFKIEEEGFGRVISLQYTIAGQLMKARESGDVYALDAIKRVLKDLPLKAPKPVIKPKPKRVTAKKPARTQGPAPKPAREPEVLEEPLVIMAPEDITGSVRSAGANNTPVPQRVGTASLPGNELLNEIAGPSALSNVPKGVILRRN